MSRSTAITGLDGRDHATRRVVLAGAAALALTPARAADGPPRGALLILGGGDRDLSVQRAAWYLAGGAAARWVYIPTAQRDEDLAASRPPLFARRARAQVAILHTRDRALADTPAFAAPLADATAVFLEGGRQWRLADAYLGTRTQVALAGVLARGGLVCGASAGASILASFLVRGSPLGDQIVVDPAHAQGFGFVAASAIDTHVVRRGRQRDLAGVVAAHPELLGIGLDEGAGVVVRGDRMTAVNGRAILLTDGENHGGRPYYPLPLGAAFDLAARRMV
ncbi:MAG: cyanophycinase [Caulobacteraceae bacterium]|nr:cyanophycinase [Caulobacteraceae bacterium]